MPCSYRGEAILYKHSTNKSGIGIHGEGSVVRRAAFWMEIKLVWCSLTSPTWPDLIPYMATPPKMCVAVQSRNCIRAKGLLLTQLTISL